MRKISTYAQTNTSHASRLQLAERDLFQELLADKKSPNTRRAYAKDLRLFFRAIASDDPTPELIAEFLTLDRFSAVSLVLKYKAVLVEKELAEATINRRLAAIKSLVNYARRIGKCDYSLEDVKGEKIQAYRDTSGISADAFIAVCKKVEYRRSQNSPLSLHETLFSGLTTKGG